MMQVMKDIGGVEMPEFLARLTPDSGVRNGATAEPTPTAPSKDETAEANAK
jgi:hypothetical protein